MSHLSLKYLISTIFLFYSDLTFLESIETQIPRNNVLDKIKICTPLKKGAEKRVEVAHPDCPYKLQPTSQQDVVPPQSLANTANSIPIPSLST